MKGDIPPHTHVYSFLFSLDQVKLFFFMYKLTHWQLLYVYVVFFILSFFYPVYLFCWRETTVLITKIIQRIACHCCIAIPLRLCTLCARKIKIITHNNCIITIHNIHTLCVCVCILRQIYYVMYPRVGLNYSTDVIFTLSFRASITLYNYRYDNISIFINIILLCYILAQ
jgi:hypothetical protein